MAWTTMESKFISGGGGPSASAVSVPYDCCGCGMRHDKALYKCPKCGLLVPWLPQAKESAK